MTTSEKPGMSTQNSSNRKERGFFGPWQLASKRGQWSESEEDRACKNVVIMREIPLLIGEESINPGHGWGFLFIRPSEFAVLEVNIF
jgi:hypothetical protein